MAASRTWRRVLCLGLLLAAIAPACSDDDGDTADEPTSTTAPSTTARPRGEPSDTSLPTSSLPVDDPATPEDEAAVARFCEDANRFGRDVRALAERGVVDSGESFREQLRQVRDDLAALRRSAPEAVRPELDELGEELDDVEAALRDRDGSIGELLGELASEAMDAMSALFDVVERLARVC
jgi:hypothetical protein